MKKMFKFRSYGGEYRMAETEITFLGEVIGYTGASSSEERTQAAAERIVHDALREFYRPVIEKIQGDPQVTVVSRFEEDYD